MSSKALLPMRNLSRAKSIRHTAVLRMAVTCILRILRRIALRKVMLQVSAATLQIKCTSQKLISDVVGTGPPGWPSPTRTLYNYGGSQSSSTYVGLSAGATAGPRYGVDAAGLALIAAGAILM